MHYASPCRGFWWAWQISSTNNIQIQIHTKYCRIFSYLSLISTLLKLSTQSSYYKYLHLWWEPVKYYFSAKYGRVPFNVPKFRVFHLKCVHLDASPAEDWVCPECVLVMAAENLDTRWAFSLYLYLYLYFQLLPMFVLSFCICVCKSCWSGLEQCGCWV